MTATPPPLLSAAQRSFIDNSSADRLKTELAEAFSTIERPERELAESGRDAERYRWLRDLKCNQLYLTRDADHACNYITASEWIEGMNPEWFAGDPVEDIQKMKDTNTIWGIQIYPNTPIGFSNWNRATLDEAIDAAITAMQPVSSNDAVEK